MTNKIQELTVNETWRDEQDAWNHRSEYFVEMHNRKDRKAQVTDFLAFLKDENLLPAANGRTLDVGCGVCDYALGLAREGYKATGIDLSDGMIRGAKQLAEAEGLDLSLYILDLGLMKLVENSVGIKALTWHIVSSAQLCLM